MGKQKHINPLHLGLIGKTLDYSFSKSYFDKKFENPKFRGFTYQNFELKNQEELQHFFQQKSVELDGFNVTIPYKEAVLSFLDFLDENALKIGAVNTVSIKKGMFFGYNTDQFGFENAIKPFLKKNHQKALILGTGGASKAIAFTFKKLNIPFIFVSRNPIFKESIGYDKLDQNHFENYQIIVNTTPLGTYPNIKAFPQIPFHLMNSNHLAFDLIYNPSETEFLKRAKNQGATTSNGLTMLTLQAEKAWKIWNAM